MAKKICLILSFICVSFLALGLTLNALDLGIEDEFEEISTDKSFMLDSSLFTHEYAKDTYVTPTADLRRFYLMNILIYGTMLNIIQFVLSTNLLAMYGRVILNFLTEQMKN